MYSGIEDDDRMDCSPPCLEFESHNALYPSDGYLYIPPRLSQDDNSFPNSRDQDIQQSMRTSITMSPSDRDTLPSMQQRETQLSTQTARMAAMQRRLFPFASGWDMESAGQLPESDAMTPLEYETPATLSRTCSAASMEVRPPSPDRSLPSPTQPLRLMSAEEVQERRAFPRLSDRPSLMRRCSSKVSKVVDGLREWAIAEELPHDDAVHRNMPSNTESAKPPPMPITSATQTLKGIPTISLAEAQARVKADPLGHAFEVDLAASTIPHTRNDLQILVIAFGRPLASKYILSMKHPNTTTLDSPFSYKSDLSKISRPLSAPSITCSSRSLIAVPALTERMDAFKFPVSLEPTKYISSKRSISPPYEVYHLYTRQYITSLSTIKLSRTMRHDCYAPRPARIRNVASSTKHTSFDRAPLARIFVTTIGLSLSHKAFSYFDYNALYDICIRTSWYIFSAELQSSSFFCHTTTQPPMRNEDHHINSSHSHSQYNHQPSSNLRDPIKMSQPPSFGAARAAQAALLAGEAAASPPRPRPPKSTRQLQHLEAGTLRKPKAQPQPSIFQRCRSKVATKLQSRNGSRPQQEAGPSAYERIAEQTSDAVPLETHIVKGIAIITLAEARERVRQDPVRHAYL
ncbi:uncharacterized protein MYCFIDRAFT_177564 [Pseudocercospora fijiensis CIRAD86]|uniref:Uncharacterized protein n=1 Tax=Pseudocercospora fijiensis (strain CIRAD86) TaxID=383855 RepID=M3AT16_PSEFD|nr:uncharacterized protein MYCFIDRAFT_177564 [Pseudocercospora fijiensis CIRAD86]EME80632.1 hypothetical protein MYCFIDRAFT_177564 [Pseudocercospora fijiensis CIRAD86]